jgi:hypothetical protein
MAAAGLDGRQGMERTTHWIAREVRPPQWRVQAPLSSQACAAILVRYIFQRQLWIPAVFPPGRPRRPRTSMSGCDRRDCGPCSVGKLSVRSEQVRPQARCPELALLAGGRARFLCVRRLSRPYAASFHPQGTRKLPGKQYAWTVACRPGHTARLKFTFVLFVGTDSAAVRNRIGSDG